MISRLLLTVFLWPLAARSEALPWEPVAASNGLDFVHFNGMTGKTHFAEMMGAGGAFVDIDNDGDLDIYLVQGAVLGPDEKRADALIDVPHQRLSDRLYRQDRLKDGVPQFTDITDKAGLAVDGYGMGVVSGDYDNDGFVDLYIANFGANTLLRNRGDGTFEDVTARAGVDDPRWSIGGTFGDYDGDGWLDLYVVNYVNFSFTTAKTCRSHFDAADYCSPQSYEPVSDRLFRNRGDGTFEDVSARVGIEQIEAPGLGVVSGDFDADGRLDFYVANDGADNQLWLNQGGRFIDEALLAGVAVNMQGTPEASMGVDAADFDGDGDLDLFMTHLDRQTNTLYVNDGQGWFSDRSAVSALGKSSFPFTGFGTRWFDMDNDGWLDLVSVNGAVVKIEEQVEAGKALPLEQTNQIWRNQGAGEYVEVSAQAGPSFTGPNVGRGLAIGDVNNDGATDLLVTVNAGPARLLLNRAAADARWVGLDVRRAGRPDLGARVEVGVGERQIHRVVRSDGSYASAHDPRVLVGLGTFAGAVDVKVRFSDGQVEEFPDLEPGRYHTLDSKR